MQKINLKFKIFGTIQTNVKHGENNFIDENTHSLESIETIFYCDSEEIYKKKFKEHLKNNIISSKSKIESFKNKNIKNIYICSQVEYPNSTMALEYNSSIDPNVIFETKKGVTIDKIDFVI